MERLIEILNNPSDISIGPYKALESFVRILEDSKSFDKFGNYIGKLDNLNEEEKKFLDKLYTSTENTLKIIKNWDKSMLDLSPEFYSIIKPNLEKYRNYIKNIRDSLEINKIYNSKE
jgi:hypothetical protein